MSASTASACDAEPALRAFILGNLDDVSETDRAFPDLAHEMDETDVDLSGICEWLDRASGNVDRGVDRGVPLDVAGPTTEHDDVFRDFLRTMICAGDESSEEGLVSVGDDDGGGERNETETLDAKRLRNRASAAMSRARKRNELATLRRHVRELEKANQHLSYAAQCAFAENAALRCRLGFQPRANVCPEASREGATLPSAMLPNETLPNATSGTSGTFETETESNARLDSKRKRKATEPAALERGESPVPDMRDDREGTAEDGTRRSTASLESFRNDFAFRSLRIIRARGGSGKLAWVVAPSGKARNTGRRRRPRRPRRRATGLV
jgi:hypothetical protein